MASTQTWQQPWVLEASAEGDDQVWPSAGQFMWHMQYRVVKLDSIIITSCD